MAPLVKIALTLLVVGIVSALVAPPIYWFIQTTGAHFFPWLGTVPFHRVFSRVLLVCILLAVGPLLLSLRISSFTELGLKKNPHWKADLIGGLFIALLTVTLLMTTYISFGACTVSDTRFDVSALLRIALTAIGVSILEETIFRGLLYGLSRRTFSAVISALWTSLLFATLHFIRSSGSTDESLNIWSGFREFERFFSGAPPFPVWVFAFVTLFLIGLLLCWTVERTRSLSLAIGLHMGWIFAIQTINLFTKFQIQSPSGLPWMGPNVVSGTVPVGIFVILSICVTFLLCWKYLHGLRR